MLQVFLAVSPVIVIFLLMVVFKRTADVAGLLGWVYTALLAGFAFGTDWEVVLIASLAGIIASFPISLMVAASIFQINIMEEAGALKRVVAFFKTLASDNRAVQVMLLNVGIGTLLAALGATPVSILPPIMLALGYTAFVAVALPALGYDALCTYALLGVPVVVFADVASKIVPGAEYTPAEVGLFFAQFMPVITTLIALAMLWLIGGWKEVRKGWFIALLTGLTAGFIAIGMNFAGLPTLTGVVAGIGVVAVMLLYLKLSGKKLIDRSQLSDEDMATEKKMPIMLAVLPWVLLVVFSILTNFDPLGIKEVLFTKWAMPVELVPGKPEKLRMLWHAYTWVLIATLIAIPLYRMREGKLSAAFKKTARRVPRPAFAAAIYFAIAFVLNHSGKVASSAAADKSWVASDTGGNMVGVAASASANAFGAAYGGAAAFLGLLGGFISGSETSSIAMLTGLHYETTQLLYGGATDAEGIFLLIAAVSGIGGGLASVISPAKLQNAAAVIDKIGLETKVIRSTVVISLVMTTVAALMTYVFLALM